MEINNKVHEIFSNNRENIKLSGVNDVESFDDRGIVMQTCLGRLAIEGEGLHISLLDIQSGNIEIEGKIDGVFYLDESAKRKKGLFSKGN